MRYYDMFDFAWSEYEADRMADDYLAAVEESYGQQDDYGGYGDDYGDDYGGGYDDYGDYGGGYDDYGGGYDDYNGYDDYGGGY